MQIKQSIYWDGESTS